jgi:hypothetical protein
MAPPLLQAEIDFAVRTVQGGERDFEAELVDGMTASLARIKAAAES